jgi:hypothetical protein
VRVLTLLTATVRQGARQFASAPQALELHQITLRVWSQALQLIDRTTIRLSSAAEAAELSPFFWHQNEL